MHDVANQALLEPVGDSAFADRGNVGGVGA
jgi:hypothetical protein